MTGLPTLDEFLERGSKVFPRNSYVREKGFKSLYVRWGYHNIRGRVLPCFDLASMEATKPGKGAFKALIAKLRKEHPALHLYAESVLNEKLVPGLLRLGFQQVTKEPPHSFFLRGDG